SDTDIPTLPIAASPSNAVSHQIPGDEHSSSWQRTSANLLRCRACSIWPATPADTSRVPYYQYVRYLIVSEYARRRIYCTPLPGIMYLLRQTYYRAAGES